MVDVPNDVGVPSVAPETRTADDYLQIQPKAGEGLAQVGQSAVDLSKVFGQVQVNDVTNQVMKQARDITDHFQSLSGKDALDAQASTQAALDKVFADGGSQLGSLDQQDQYNQTTRTYQDRYFGGMIASHAAQAGQEYQKQVNATTYENGMNQIASNPDSDSNFQLGLNLALGGAVKDLQASGNATDKTLMGAAVAKATQDAWATRIQAVAVKDPLRAQQMADANQANLGPKYAEIADALRDRADAAAGVQAGQAALAGSGAPGASGATAPMPATPGNVSSDQVWGAILGNESSGGNINSAASPDGAIGAGQIMPATFQANAKPGQNINNPADNLDVSRRLIQHYYQQYNGDPARVAVAYFSGPGNVAPAGSPTPWINDFRDQGGKGTPVSTYVANALNRLQPGTAANPKASAYAAILDNPNLSPQAREHAIEYVNQTLTLQQVADQGTQQQQDMASQKAANDYTTQMLTAVSNGQAIPPDFLQHVAADPSLKADAKTALFDYALRLTGDSKAVGYGPGYLKAYNSILAPYGTPGKISDPTSILQMAGPGGPLTPTGAQALIQTLQQSQSGIDGAGIEQSKASVLNYAKSKLSFEDDTGPVKIPDPVGERAFDAQFVPQFEAGYAAWVKAGKDPMAYLGDTKSIDAMINRIRPASQMAQDKIAAMNGLTGDDTQQTPGVAQNAPPPPPPPGIAAGKWGGVVSDTPGQGASKWSQGAWGQALALLMSDPKKYGPYFDAKFGADGFSAAQVVQQLSGPDAPPVQMPAYGAAAGGFN